MASSCAHHRRTTLAAAAWATRPYAAASMPSASCLGPAAVAAASAWRCGGLRRLASSSSSAGKKAPPPPPARAHHKPLPYHAKAPLPSSLASSSSPTEPAAATATRTTTAPKRRGAPPPPPPPDAASSSSSSSQAQPVDQLFRSRWIGIFGAGAAALCLGSFSASLWMANGTDAPRYTTGREPAVPTGRPAIESPVEFDLHLDKSEWRSGITALRRRLAARAAGHVLEVAFGTGRNVEFYDWAFVDDEDDKEQKQKKKKKKTATAAAASAMQSFTGVDISPAMLDLGLRRLRQNVPAPAGLADALPKQPSFATLAAAGDGDGGVRLLDGRLRIYAADAQDALPPPPPLAGQKYYDTVVQTFGLCSVRDPALLLRRLAAVVRPGTGRIVLLEHGRSNSWWDVVNRMLDRSAQGHFDRFGCWWNRDIERLVRDAQEHVPGLEIVDIDRPGWTTLGTHIWVELRVRPTEQPPAAGDKATTTESQTAGRAAGFWASLGSWGFPTK